MSTTSSIAKPEFENGQIISGYEVIRKLGSGGFGAVYHVRKDGVDAALKTEFVVKGESETLPNEVHMLRLMQWSKSFCRLHSAKSLVWNEQKVNIMVMSLCGRPLSRLRRMMPNRHFSRSTAARVAKQILEALHDLHQSGIIHRDVKASNCGWHQESRRILLFDLGFCRKFLEIDAVTKKIRHRKSRKAAGFMGTSKYCSVYAHVELDQGRRDDLWAWLYTTFEFFMGGLPWSQDENSHKVYQQKMDKGLALFQRCPREILEIYLHVKTLKFDSCPDYGLMFEQFRRLFARLDILDSDALDFEQGSDYFEKYFEGKQSDSEKEEDEEVTSELADREIESGLTDPVEVVTLNSSENESKKNPMVMRLAAGFNRALNRMLRFKRKGDSKQENRSNL